jgi:3-oxoacyl-(acyl-carrier-protein) synthase
MDPRPEASGDDPVAVSGLGHEVPAPDVACDPMPFLKVKKMRKYMGVQDDLAVCAAARALESAGLGGAALGERAGLYLVVGSIPFEQSDLDPLLAASVEGGVFSMRAFSTAGFKAVNGLLTFRCLPNMPAFHVSLHCDIQGPYFVSYPGPGQFYVALEQALADLEEGRVDIALVGGVAHQRNYLTAYHYSRLTPPVLAEDLADAAGFLVLERSSQLRARQGPVRGRLLSWELSYQPFNPFENPPTPRELFALRDVKDPEVPGDTGPASLPAMLSRAAGRTGRLAHELFSRDGFLASSRWELT